MFRTTLACLLALALGPIGCGSPSTPVHTGTVQVDPSEMTASEMATPEISADPWQAMNGETLREFVQAAAFEGLAEVQEGATPAALDSWLASPDEAPSFGGRATERLLELAAVSVAGGDAARGESIIRLVRAHAANRNQAFTGNTLLTEIARREAAEGASEAAITGVLRELPRTRFGSATVVFQFFQNQSQLTAQLEQIHGQLISRDTAASALYFEQLLPGIVEHRDIFLSAIDAVRAAHDASPALEEYEFETVDLSRARDAQPVMVAVWDLGVNGALFEEQLFTNPNEEVNGEDDDDNGLVDDLHGVAQDVGDYDHEDLLFQPDPALLAEYTPFLQGIMDLRAGLGSSEAAQQVLALVGGVTDASELQRLSVNLDRVGEWAHGTHVAGILLAGLPQARLSIFRSSWAGEARLYHDRGPTDVELAAERTNVEQIAAFINAHGIKVLNASLGFSLEYVADALRHESEIYPDDTAVMARAHVVQAHRQETWDHVFDLCPNTLFVVAAGNSNQDVLEYGVVPASNGRENVLVIGAVDRYGQWATFTNSNPERVRVFDFGVEVPSLIPDGSTVPLSGTSMASPNTANLAAKLYALDPNLTPAIAIQIIQETADPIAEPFNGRIANETAAIRQVRRTRRSRRPRRASRGNR